MARPVAADHEFAQAEDLTLSYHFNEIQIYGHSHFAIEPENVGDFVDLDFLYMIGDRTGTIHIGDNQVRRNRRQGCLMSYKKPGVVM